MGLYGSPDLSNNLQDNAINEKNMIYCENCGTKYSKKIKKCPNCGKKHSQPFYNKWWFWVIVLIMFFSIVPPPNSNNNTNDINNAQITISEEAYKEGCVSIPYIDIARNPNNYVGQNVVFSGKVVQVQESGKHITLRVNVTEGEYGIWQDTIYVDYERKSDNESRILEEDIITMYGKVKGIKTYKAVLGNQVSIPYLIVEYIKIN